MAGWWIDSFGGFDALVARTSVVTPTEDDFPVDLTLEGHPLASDYLAFVKEHAGPRDWPIIAVEERTPESRTSFGACPIT